MMKRKEIFTEKNLIIVAAVFFAAAMVVFPAVTEAGTKSAISIWLNSVVPVLLPFFIFADFIKQIIDIDRLPYKVYPLTMAFLSGYPMGAKVTGDLVVSGALSREKGLHILSYSLVTGPAFILGAGSAFLGNLQAAAIVALAHYAGALCNGMFWRCDERVKNKDIYGLTGTMREVVSGRYLESFTSAILAGFRAMAIILAWLMIFMICAYMSEEAGLLDFLPDEGWRSFVKGLFEMTMGISSLGMCNMNLGIKTVLTAFLISFGGLSVIGQSLSVAGGDWITPGRIVKIKLTHGLIAGILAEIMIISGKYVFAGQFMV